MIGRSRQGARARGQSLVEFALILPLLLLLVFGILEFGRLLNCYVIVTNGAREGARYAAVGYPQADVVQKVRDVTITLDPPVDVDVVGIGSGAGNPVTVTVTYNMPLILPLLSTIIPDPFPMVATAQMRLE